MLFVDNQNLVPYSSGTIQMVPGKHGYEPAYRRSDSDERGLKSFNNALYRRSGALNEKYESTYSKNRRLTSSGLSDIGSQIDIYA